MREDEKRRRVDKVRDRERLRQSEERARANSGQDRSKLSRFSEGFKRAREKYTNAKGYVDDLKTIATSRGDWRKQYEAVHGIAERTNNMAVRQGLSQDITERVLQGVSRVHVDAISAFEVEFAKVNLKHNASVRAAAKRREATERQAAAKRRIEAERSAAAASRAADGYRTDAEYHTAAERRAADARNAAYARQRRQAAERQRQQAAQQQNTGALFNSLASGIAGAAAIYGASQGSQSNRNSGGSNSYCPPGWQVTYYNGKACKCGSLTTSRGGAWKHYRRVGQACGL